MSEILVEVRRGSYVESVHRGNVAVVDTLGNVVAAVGDPDYYTFMRSSAKPIQALGIVESGAYEAFGFTKKELAVMCASHGGESFHVETVYGILAKLGLDESSLRCGTHLPYHVPTAEAMTREGRRPTAVHCNCSGKHSGMLAIARRMGWPLEGYWKEDHPVQKLNKQNVAEVSGYRASRIGVAVDGCGVPVFALPLRHMAQAFARLANPVGSDFSFAPERAEAAELIVRSMRAHPEMVAGTGRLCTALMRSAPVVAKSGAEGVYCIGLPGKGLGVALKIDDGNSRASNPAAVRVLEALGVLTPKALEELELFRRPVNRNNRGDVVGTTEAVFNLAYYL